MSVTTKDICKACEDIKSYSPDFVAKGVTEQMCSYLKANQGLENTGRKNCTDLHNANDCLIGGIAEKAESYDSCDPNQMIEDLAKNTMHVMDMLICSDCGQWEQIEAIWEEIQKIWDAINALKAQVSNQGTTLALLQAALEKILNNLKNSGAWNQTGDTIYEGDFNSGRNLATGNINLFGGSTDGSSFIRTNNGSTENDLAGGI